MDSADSRLERLRHRKLADQVENVPDKVSPVVRWLGTVYNGGAIPTTGDKYFLCHPTQINESETEGGPGSFVVDTDQSESVLVLNNPASVGDKLNVFGIAGRWVAEKHGAALKCGVFTCGSCDIPKTDLTVAWSNGVIGNGSTTLFFNGISTWTSACTNELLYEILCNAGQVEFRVVYFITGACPSGTQNYCSTLGSNPLKLTRTSLTCGLDFDLEATVSSAGCPNLWENGYTAFSITGTAVDPPVCPVCVSVGGVCGHTLSPIAGATVTLCDITKKTASSGLVIIDIGSPQTCMITVEAAGYVTYTDTRAFVCGQSVTILLTLDSEIVDPICCGFCPLPQTLYIDWVNGVQPATWNATFNLWRMSTTVTVAGITGTERFPPATTPCDCGENTGDMTCIATIQCILDPTTLQHELKVICTWTGCKCTIFDQGPVGLFYFLDDFECVGLSGPGPGGGLNPFGDSVGGTAVLTDCLDSDLLIPLTGTPSTPNPGSGTVTITRS